MKKNIIFILILFISLSAAAATYKINESGKIYTPSGNQIQNTPASQNYYNTYTPQNYITSNAINATSAQGVIEIIMDFSGSMADWVSVAKGAMTSIVAQIPPNTLVGFRTFGQSAGQSAVMGQVEGIIAVKNKKGKTVYKALTGKHLVQSGGCSATKQVTPISAVNSSNLIFGMNSVDLGGSTPMVLGLQKTVYNDFVGLSQTLKKKIVLITDGGENCGGDPCAFAKTLMKQRSDIHIDVILVGSNSKKLKCLSKTTNGTFYNSKKLSDFSTVLTQSMTNIPKTEPVKQTQEPQGQSYEFIDY